MRRVCTVTLIALATSTAFAVAASASLSPHSLYTKLVTTAYPDSQLPSGFFSAKVSVGDPSSNAKKYHVTGEVDVAIDGPDPDDGIIYEVFPSPADARGLLAHPKTSGHTKVVGKVPGYSRSVWMIGSVTGKNALGKTITDGITVMAVAKGNVLVEAFTDSADNQSSGNTPAALALLRSALRHLAKVSAPS
jgi:hypothetical protein